MLCSTRFVSRSKLEDPTPAGAKAPVLFVVSGTAKAVPLQRLLYQIAREKAAVGPRLSRRWIRLAAALLCLLGGLFGRLFSCLLGSFLRRLLGSFFRSLLLCRFCRCRLFYNFLGRLFGRLLRRRLFWSRFLRRRRRWRSSGDRRFFRFTLLDLDHVFYDRNRFGLFLFLFFFFFVFLVVG